jgi:hypothetical protein
MCVVLAGCLVTFLQCSRHLPILWPAHAHGTLRLIQPSAWARNTPPSNSPLPQRLLGYLAGANEDDARLLPPTVPLETILFPADRRSETVEGRFCVALYLPECAQVSGVVILTCVDRRVLSGLSWAAANGIRCPDAGTWQIGRGFFHASCCCADTLGGPKMPSGTKLSRAALVTNQQHFTHRIIVCNTPTFFGRTVPRGPLTAACASCVRARPTGSSSRSARPSLTSAR